MSTSQSWWKSQSDAAPQPQRAPEPAPAAGPEITPEPDPVFDDRESIDDHSIGEQIDRAIGDFDAKIVRLKEQHQLKQTEVRELEIQITDLEKEQAKAFKSVLGDNPQIKKLLAGRSAGSKKKSSPRRKKAPTEPRSEELSRSEELDHETLL